MWRKIKDFGHMNWLKSVHSANVRVAKFDSGGSQRGRKIIFLICASRRSMGKLPVVHLKMLA